MMEAVQELRRLHRDEGLSYNELGRRFGIAGNTAADIVRGKLWRI